MKEAPHSRDPTWPRRLAGPTHQSSCSICPVCSHSMPLTKSGDLRIHGPLHNRCGVPGMHPSPKQYLCSVSLCLVGGEALELALLLPSETQVSLC